MRSASWRRVSGPRRAGAVNMWLSRRRGRSGGKWLGLFMMGRREGVGRWIRCRVRAGVRGVSGAGCYMMGVVCRI